MNERARLSVMGRRFGEGYTYTLRCPPRDRPTSKDAHVNSHYNQLTPRHGYDANRATERSLGLRTEDHYQWPCSLSCNKR